MAAMDFHFNKRFKAHPSCLYGLGNFPKRSLLFLWYNVQKRGLHLGNGPWKYEQNLRTTLFLTYLLSIQDPTDLAVMLPLDH